MGGEVNKLNANTNKPASDYQLIRRVCLSRRCRGSWREFRLPTGMLRLADYLERARSDWQLNQQSTSKLQSSYNAPSRSLYDQEMHLLR